MSAVFDKLDNLGKELTACQLDANMTIADISVVDALNRIKNISLDVSSTVRISFLFFLSLWRMRLKLLHIVLFIICLLPAICYF